MSEFLYSDKWFLAQRRSLLAAKRSNPWRDAPMWLRIVCIAALANFFSFSIIAQLNGGDALSGKEEAGKYFLGGRGHHYTVVSKACFQYSAIHAYLVIINCLGAILGHFYWVRKKATRTGD